jgi:hypothetical protein
LLTLHVTALELTPVTVAMNCTVRPSETDGFCGDTLTLTFCGGPLDAPVANPHPLQSSAKHTPMSATEGLTVAAKEFGKRNEFERGQLIERQDDLHELFHCGASWPEAPHRDNAAFSEAPRPQLDSGT